jgi:hypothetical protein
VPFDGALSIVLMLTGAVVALAGIGVLTGWVAEEVAAVAALVAGLAIFALPWLATWSPPAREPVSEPVAAGPGVVVVSPDGLRTVAATPPPQTPPPPLPGREAARIAVEGREAEPNDTLAAANVAALGTAIDGEAAPGDRDWFAVDVPPGTRGALVANLVTEDASVTLALFDDAGQTLGLAATIDQIRVRSASLERRLDRPRFYVRVTPTTDVAARYQLTVAARRR